MKRLSCGVRVGSRLLVVALVLAAAVGCGGEGAEVGAPPETTAPTTGPQLTRANLPYDSSPGVSPADQQAFLNGANGFGMDLFRRLSGDKNVVFSPVSLGTALSMAYAGAAGDTAGQMKTVLRDPFGDERYHRSVNQLLLDLRSRNRAAASAEDSRSVGLSLVDAVWLQLGMEVRAGFLDILARHYDAGVQLADFAGDPEAERVNINDFASEATRGQIKDLIPRGEIDDLTRAVLVNATYLKASWDQPFDPARTAEGIFRVTPDSQASVPMMHVTRAMGYVAGPDFQAVALPYVGGELQMLVVVPAEGKLASVRDGMDEAWLAGVLGSLADTTVDLSVPKFRITWGTEKFNDTLSGMGMPLAFNDQKADFSNLSDQRLHITAVLQKAFVGIDESGTEAAAASAVIIGGKGPTPSPEVTVTADHPFLFAITDKTGAVLFAGQVTDPR
ncbi:serpin family protein [Mycobacterium sp. TJFP1]